MRCCIMFISAICVLFLITAVQILETSPKENHLYRVWHMSLIRVSRFYKRTFSKGQRLIAGSSSLTFFFLCRRNLRCESCNMSFKINLTKTTTRFFRFVALKVWKERHEGNIWVYSFKPDITGNKDCLRQLVKLNIHPL